MLRGYKCSHTVSKPITFSGDKAKGGKMKLKTCAIAKDQSRHIKQEANK